MHSIDKPSKGPLELIVKTENPNFRNNLHITECKYLD